MADRPGEADRLTQLEELLAHQQRLLEQLNGTVTEQRLEMDTLQSDQRKLKETVARLMEYHEGAEDTPGERPPHY